MDTVERWTDSMLRELRTTVIRCEQDVKDLKRELDFVAYKIAQQKRLKVGREKLLGRLRNNLHNFPNKMNELLIEDFEQQAFFSRLTMKELRSKLFYLQNLLKVAKLESKRQHARADECGLIIHPKEDQNGSMSR